MFFSVIIPYYNNKDYIKKTISSVVSQTVNQFELLIVDDGSCERIDDLIESFDDDRIKYFFKTNEGVSKTRNFGIEKAIGEWICFLDSDDEWLPNHLSEIEKMHNLYPDCMFYLTSHKTVGAGKENASCDCLPFEGEYCLVHDFLRLVWNNHGIIHTNSVCLKKELIIECGGFDESTSRGEDTDLWYRCSMLSDVALSKCITTIYHRENSFLTKKKPFNYGWVFLKNVQELLNNPSIEFNKKRSAKILVKKYELSICKHLLTEGRKKQANEIFKQIDIRDLKELKHEKSIVKVLLMLPSFLSQLLLNKYFNKGS